MKALLLLYRDLRVTDQTALSHALREADELAIAYIYDENSEGIPFDSRYAGHSVRTRQASLAHMRTALMGLGHQVSSYVGDYVPVLKKIQSVYPFDVIYLNRFYDAPGQNCFEAAKGLGVELKAFEDAVVFSSRRILKKDGSPYQMFTPYYHQWLDRLASTPFEISDLPSEYRAEPVDLEENAFLEGIEVLPSLPDYNEMMVKYNLFLKNGLITYMEDREIPSLEGTSGMSVFLNTGMMSPRVFVSRLRQVQGHDALLRQYVWREFYQQLLANTPRLIHEPMRREYGLIYWEEDPGYFEAWTSGTTGVPLVDAAMRALRATGRLHNRLRMVAASYLIKDLHVNWQLGEKYFMEQLADAEPALNNGGWQWCASTGTDSQAYFRVLNPWKQSLKYDSEAIFMKRWLPEYETAPAEAFHKENGLIGFRCPKSLVDHSLAVRQTKALYQASKMLYKRKENASE
ncbi:MAG: deoxyribodipyrimidine photo-lyase [Erysipelotrichaceae bacterium]|nr:deoxyribodipyrimidine photo-lyase [Erysipelotrichaceae bacterium]